MFDKTKAVEKQDTGHCKGINASRGDQKSLFEKIKGDPAQYELTDTGVPLDFNQFLRPGNRTREVKETLIQSPDHQIIKI